MLLNRIYQWARIQPRKPALIYDDVILDYAYFARSIETTRKFLKPKNFAQGTTAVILATNAFDAWRLIIGLRSIGLNTIVVSSIDAAQALQIRDVSRIVVTELAYQFHRLGEQSLPGSTITVVPRVVDANIHTADIPENVDDNHANGGHILYTSGTTGTNKKLKVDGANEDKQNRTKGHAYSIDEGTIYQGSNFAPWTQIGFRMAYAVWNAGGCVVFYQPAGEDYGVFFRHGVNLSIIIPQQLRDLLQSVGISDRHHNECRLYITAGFLSATLAENAIRKLTNNLYVSYGSTELCAPAMVSRFEGISSLHWLAPVGGRVIQIVDQVGNQCPVGQEGELRILCEDTDCKSYLDDDQTSAKFFRNGFLYPGDMAISRADGRIRILGRVSDVINVKGAKYAVGPIEQTICHFLQVDEVCLFANLNDQGQEELIVAIQSETRPSAEKLEHVRKSYPGFDLTRFAVLSEFPRTEETRKVRRAELKALILAGRN